MSGKLIFSVLLGESNLKKQQSLHIREKPPLPELRAKLYLQGKEFCPGSLFNKHLSSAHHDTGVTVGI